MRYVAKCLRELAFVAFRCGKYEDVPKHLEAAAELDRRAKKVIIENRYNDDQRATTGDGGRMGEVRGVQVAFIQKLTRWSK